MNRNDPTADSGEALSALIDGELPVDEAGDLIARLGRDRVLRARWARFHTQRSALEGAVSPCLGAGFSERVRTATEAEPTVLAPGALGRRPRAWARPLAGLAIAASVAVLAVGALLALQAPAPGGADGLMVSREARALGAGGLEAPAAAVERVAAPAGLTLADHDAASAAVRERMGIYLANHAQYAGAADMPGVVPYSRLIGFNAGQ